ncbi:toll/interleukin-1 receptor domain-containing protein [Candidatus Magnetobacterium casense]|uniref:toll/interleukin-1 receptor domain-containing protein n=1 Tax=Candidatus Magnetobacterium casense TaxID=1455061 RepID=UPI00058CFF63|nr:toll/interleukin-1 receptor domain-containing protein [Candidatus Magnetobacterium casensis]
MYDVYLSYMAEDKAIVGEIARLLKDEYHLEVWLDKWNIVPGDSIHGAILKGLKEAKTCAIFTGKSTPGGWFKEEISVALSRLAEDTSFRVIPVLLPGGKNDNIPDFLQSRSFVDFSKGIYSEYEMYRLVCAIKGIQPVRGSVHDKFTGLKEFKTLGIITEEIYLETQRRIIDKYIKH